MWGLGHLVTSQKVQLLKVLQFSFTPVFGYIPRNVEIRKISLDKKFPFYGTILLCKCHEFMTFSSRKKTPRNCEKCETEKKAYL